MIPLFHSSPPDRWVMPRPTRDPARARAIYGPLVPMDTPRRSLLQRIIGKE